MLERGDLLLAEGGASGDRAMESAVQHGAAAFVAGLQATGTGSPLAEAPGAWRCGKPYAFPTSPHPRRRLRTQVQRGVTLTFHLVQKIGQVTAAARSQPTRVGLLCHRPRRVHGRGSHRVPCAETVWTGKYDHAG